MRLGGSAVVSRFRHKAEIYREFGWRWNRLSDKPLVHCYASPRYMGSGAVKRLRPMLAYEGRKRGGMLWAGGPRWWGRFAPLNGAEQ